jgi:hypothetical protein
MKSRVLVPCSHYFGAVTIGVLFCVGAVACASQPSTPARQRRRITRSYGPFPDDLQYAQSQRKHLTILSLVSRVNVECENPGSHGCDAVIDFRRIYGLPRQSQRFLIDSEVVAAARDMRLHQGAG